MSRKSQEALIQELIDLRHEAGLTQRQVAEKMGVHLTMVQRIENKKTDERTLGTLFKYAEAVGARINLEAYALEQPVTGL